MKRGFRWVLLLLVTAAAGALGCSGDKTSKPVVPSSIVGWWRGTQPAALRTSYFSFRSDGRFSWNEYDETRDRVTCIVPSGQWEIRNGRLRLDVAPDSVLSLRFRVADHDSTTHDSLSVREAETGPDNVYVRIASPPASLAGGCDPCYNVRAGGTGGVADVRDGTWHLRTITRSGPASQICVQASDTSEVDQPICELQTGFEQGFADIPIPITCDFQVTDHTYQLTCCGDTLLPGCTLRMSLTAGGTWTDTTYTFDGTAVVSISGALCPASPPCTLLVHETGRWITDYPPCAGAASAPFQPGAFPGMKHVLRWLRPH